MRQWRILAAVPIVMAGLVLGGCGDKSSSTQTNAEQPASSAAPQESGHGNASATVAMKAFTDDGKVKEVHIEGSDLMKFNKTKLSMKPGQMVRLTLKHIGKLPAQSMGHNVVILQVGNDPFDFSADVNENNGSLANGYVPDALHDRVVAFTKLVGGGQSTSVEFQAPREPGKYPFLCSFPGHVGNMNGIVEVEN
jgi:azurin